MKRTAALKTVSATDAAFGSEVALSVRDPRNEFILCIDFKEKVDPVDWIGSHRDLLQKMMIDHGVIYLNGIGLTKTNVVSGVKAFLGDDSLLDSYRGGVTNRPRVDANLFLTTVAPSNAALLQHHEMSYMDSFPSKIFFYCNLPAEHGGATPVAYARTVKRMMDKQVYDQFKRRGITYVRNYYPRHEVSGDLVVSWQKAFEVETKAEFEQKAKAMSFHYEWLGERLRTFNKRSAIITHSKTNEEFFFNHSFVLHTYNEPCKKPCPLARAQSAAFSQEEAKLSQVPAMDQAYLVTWGDTGHVIESEILEHVFQVYNGCKQTVDWKQGNLMLVDNILASHGRDPFVGEREVLALMAK